MKKKLFATLLLAAGMVYSAVSVGISIGAPPPPRVVAIPVSPGPGYTWVGGYWYPVSGRYVWHEGYWTRPPYVGAIWVGPQEWSPFDAKNSSPGPFPVLFPHFGASFPTFISVFARTPRGTGARFFCHFPAIFTGFLPVLQTDS